MVFNSLSGLFNRGASRDWMQFLRPNSPRQRTSTGLRGNNRGRLDVYEYTPTNVYINVKGGRSQQPTYQWPTMPIWQPPPVQWPTWPPFEDPQPPVLPPPDDEFDPPPPPPPPPPPVDDPPFVGRDTCGCDFKHNEEDNDTSQPNTIKRYDGVSVMVGDARDDVYMMSGYRKAIFAGDGNDFIDDMGGACQQINGGRGDDTIKLNNTSQSVTINGGSGNDVIWFTNAVATSNMTNGSFTINGGAGQDRVYMAGSENNYVKTNLGGGAVSYRMSNQKESVVMTGVEQVIFRGSDYSYVNDLPPEGFGPSTQRHNGYIANQAGSSEPWPKQGFGLQVIHFDDTYNETNMGTDNNDLFRIFFNDALTADPQNPEIYHVQGLGGDDNFLVSEAGMLPQKDTYFSGGEGSDLFDATGLRTSGNTNRKFVFMGGPGRDILRLPGQRSDYTMLRLGALPDGVTLAGAPDSLTAYTHKTKGFQLIAGADVEVLNFIEEA